MKIYMARVHLCQPHPILSSIVLVAVFSSKIFRVVLLFIALGSTSERAKEVRRSGCNDIAIVLVHLSPVNRAGRTLVAIRLGIPHVPRTVVNIYRLLSASATRNGWTQVRETSVARAFKSVSAFYRH